MLNKARLPKRFINKINFTDSCWIWIGSKCNGYGHFSVNAGVPMGAHRFAYQALVGPIPEGLQLDHLCRNRACVNPEHLEPVTALENMRRAFAANGIRINTDTHCNRDHEFTPENTYVWSTGKRTCKACARRRSAEAYMRDPASRAIRNRKDYLARKGYTKDAPTPGQTIGPSGFKGVTFVNGKWKAKLKHNGKHITVGWFDNAVSAANAWDNAVIKTRGSDATTNKSLGLLKEGTA